MEHRKQHCAPQFIGLWLLTSLGCESPAGGPPTTTQSNPTTAGAEKANESSPEPHVPSLQKTDSDRSRTTAARATASLAPNLPEEPKIAKPTAEQLARWKFVSFDPLQLLAYLENDKAGFISFVAATNDGKQYVLGGTKLTLWSIDGKELAHEFIGAKTSDDERLLSFAYSPIGNWCVAGSASGLLRKFDIQGRKELASTPTGANKLAELAVSPDGKEIATMPFAAEVTIWNADTLERKTSFKVDAREVKRLQYVAPQVLLAAGESMSTWDTSTGNKHRAFASEKYQTAVALSPDGKELVFGAGEFLQRWDLAEDRASGEYRGVPDRNSAIRFSSDGSLIAVATGDAIRILDAATGQMLQVIDAAGSTVSDIGWVAQKHMLMVGTDSGRVRIWGRPDDCKDLGLVPLSTPSVAGTMEPATVAEILATIDLRLLPKLPGSKPQSDYFNSINYAAPVSLDEVTTFYRHSLGERGWKELFDQSTQNSMAFQKNGSVLNLSLYGEKPDQTLTSVSLLGNYDIRKTPKLDEFLKETTFEGTSTVIYKVSASLLQIETGLLRKLNKDGWTAVARLNRSSDEESDGRVIEFVKNGTVLNIMIQPDTADITRYVVSYSHTLSLHALPVPPDSGLMEWDNYNETQMVANTSLGLQAATDFYEDAMKIQGWTPREKGRRIDKDVVYLPYYWGQRDVTITLEPIADGLIRIRAGKYSSNSWQKPDDQGAEEVTTGDSKTEVESPAEEGIEAADIPILHAVGAPTYRTGASSIHFEVEKISLPELSKEYETAMKALGWIATTFGEPQETSVSLHFVKGSNTIYYQSSVDPLGIRAVDFSGNGLLWTKAIASKKLISYIAWLRNNKHPATLKRLGDYQTQMEKLAR